MSDLIVTAAKLSRVQETFPLDNTDKAVTMTMSKFVVSPLW